MIYLALPVMNEEALLPKLIEAIGGQSYSQFKVVVCINQPDHFWDDTDKLSICFANQRMLEYIYSLHDSRYIVIDKTSKGKGWLPNKHGIGFARKIIMDYIAEIADLEDIILSIDADTVFHSGYLESIAENFNSHHSIPAISVPYYHELTGDEHLNRAMLRYEIYMRAYAINMWRIQNPYCFTALGSAFALKVKVYKSVGGITPKMSGEDFYFLQKIVKTGKLLHWNNQMVFPAARYSDRVFFGTGPALIKGSGGDWSSYPIYRSELFDEVSDTCALFPILYQHDIDTPLDGFLIQKFGTLPWKALRLNYKTQEHFVRACHEKIDGLRILQFLKESQPADEKVSEMALDCLLKSYQLQFPTLIAGLKTNINFQLSFISDLDHIRNVLFEIEMHYRKSHWSNFTGLKTM